MKKTEYYDPELEGIVDFFHRVWESAILVAAMDLDLFAVLHDGPMSAEEIAEKTGYDKKGVRIILDALCPIRFIEKKDAAYALTRLSARYLDPQGEKYPGSIHWGAANPDKWNALGRLADTVREGKSLTERSGNQAEFYRGLVQSISFNAQYVVPLLAEHVQMGQGENKGWSLLDAACGEGAYGFKLLEYDPAAQLTLLDLPGVLELAREKALKLGLKDRVDFFPSDLLEIKIPERSFDLILLSHFLHSNSREDCAEIINKLAGSQKPGGIIAIHEFIPDEHRCERRFPLLFAMNMYISNYIGDTYTFSEIKAWLKAAGYHKIEYLDTRGRSGFVIARMA